MTYTEDEVLAGAEALRLWRVTSDTVDARTVLRATAPMLERRVRREVADAMDAFAADTYGEHIFPLLAADEYRALDPDLRTRFAAGCYRHALRVQAKRLRAIVDEEETP